jgi:phage terminase small subunit
MIMKEPETNTEKPSKPPTAMELRFLKEYVANGENGTQAWMRLHPKASYFSAANSASAILKKPEIQKHLEAAREAFREAYRPKFNKVLTEWGKIAYADIGDVIDFTQKPPCLRSDITPAARQAIQSITITPITAPVRKKGKRRGRPTAKIEVKMIDKRGALDKISHHLGIYEPMPPLERLLSGLPEPVANGIREYLRGCLLQRGLDPAIVPARSDAVSLGDELPRDPDGARDVPGSGVDPRPVASKIPRELFEEADGARVSSGGQDSGGGDEDIGPLFE